MNQQTGEDVMLRCEGKRPPKKVPKHKLVMNDVPYEKWVELVEGLDA